MSRKILISFDDKGRTEVEFTGDSLRFFTKREIDRALRATRMKYRQAKREHQRERIISQHEEKEKKKEKNNAKQEDIRIESRPERIEPVSSGRAEQASTSSTDALSRAIEAKQRRNGAKSNGERSREAPVAASSS